LLERAKAPNAPGQRGIDVAFLEGDTFVVLLEGSGPRYLAGGSEGATEVCMTARSLRTSGSTMAVGCGSFGQALPRVELYDGRLAKTRSIDLPTTKTPASSTEMIWPVVAEDLKRAAVPGETVDVYTLEDGTKQASCKLGTSTSPVVDMVFSGAANLIAVGREDGTVELLDVTKPDAAPTVLAPEKPDQGPALAFSSGGERLAVASFWGQFRLYARDGALVASDAADEDHYGVHDVAFAPDGRIFQIQAGDLLVRDAKGKVVQTLAATDKVSPIFGTGAPVGLGAIAVSGERLLALDADGQRVVASKF